MNRNSVIDIARGLCMIMMICTHLFNWWGNVYPWFNEYVGPFFLVFFFFSSGLCTKITNRKQIVAKRFRKLVIPYAILTLAYLWYASFSLKRWYNGKNIFETIKMAAASLLYALPSSVKNDVLFHVTTIGIGPAWFLNCMFISTVIFLLLTKLPCRYDWLASGCLMIAASISQKTLTLPCNLQDAAIGAFIMLLGYRGKTFVFSYLEKQNSYTCWKNILYLMGYCLIYALAKKRLPLQWLDLGSNIYHIPSLISTLLGFAIVLQSAVIINKTYVLQEFLADYGRESMKILLFITLTSLCCVIGRSDRLNSHLRPLLDMRSLYICMAAYAG